VNGLNAVSAPLAAFLFAVTPAAAEQRPGGRAGKEKEKKP